MTTASIAQPSYDTKSTEYFEWPRTEMMTFVPDNCRRILDVGCGGGAFGESLKRGRQVEVWGVEAFPFAAEKARGKLDHVVQGLFGPQIGLPAGTFDCVIFNDVLEHMVSPEEALRYARILLGPGGVVVASIPNIRNFPTIWQLMFHARWDYEDFGILDKTHLRFFTESSIASMFENEGYELENLRGINSYMGTPRTSKHLWWLFRLANFFLLGWLSDMKFLQFAVVAKPKVSSHKKAK